MLGRGAAALSLGPFASFCVLAGGSNVAVVDEEEEEEEEG